ncbi:hypothetical protein [Streptomyces sp. DSM 40484]|jgi:hypothetical protein|uniref:hypothetical protein n=1 Tax=Streptomyces kroppenstedtii TaxID=3051181 RepID=UPI0028D346D9|nr:hypothetical protein [Streptomyces sp. DSM 40484]
MNQVSGVGKHLDRGPTGQEDVEPWHVPALEVLIDSDGGVLIDGAPFPVPHGEPAHVAVLDMMQRGARTVAGPVEALVVDRRARYAVRIAVTADGASRIIGQEDYEEWTDVMSRPTARPEPTASPAAEPLPAGPPAPEVTFVRPTLGGPPAGGARPADVGASPPASDELAELAARIGRAIDAGALELAVVLAFKLRQYAVRTFGDEHPYTVEVLALEAFAAYRACNHTVATDTCLELARIRHQQGDPLAHEELLRAVYVWHLVDDLPSAVGLGRSLLATWSQLAKEGNTPAGDIELVRGVERRIRALVTERAQDEDATT